MAAPTTARSRCRPWLLLQAKHVRMCTSQTKAAYAAPHVAVIGAGLVGLTSAHRLAVAGFRVSIVDRQPHVANECSFANTALIMRSYSRPKTMTAAQLLAWTTSRALPVHVSPRGIGDAALLRFGLRFLLAGPCTGERIAETTRVTDALAGISSELLRLACDSVPLATPRVHRGLLMYFGDAAKLAAALAEARESFPNPEEAARRFLHLSPAECVELEPLLATQPLAGGVHWLLDFTMDPLGFANELARSLEATAAVRIVLAESVKRLRPRDGAGTASIEFESGGALADVDAVVVAAGVGSGKLLATLNSSLPPVPLYGMRGHSVTIDTAAIVATSTSTASAASTAASVSHATPAPAATAAASDSQSPAALTPRLSLCEGDTMVFFSPLRSEAAHAAGSPRHLLRCSAFGDFDGWDFGPAAIRPFRMRQLHRALGRLLGAEAERALDPAFAVDALPESALGPSLCPPADAITRWCGLRPMSPDGLPVVGFAGVSGGTPVFINAGHGALGWTLSSATAHVLASAVAARLWKGAGASRSRVSDSHAAALAELAPHLAPDRFRLPAVMRDAVLMRFRAVRRMVLGRAVSD